MYTVRLGAPSLLVGAITYGPALIAIFWQIPAGRLITRKGHRMRWVLVSGLAYRGFFLTLSLIPFFVANGQAQVTALVWVLSALVSSISNVSFLSMMADAVPADRLARMVALRFAAFGLTNTLTILLAGPLLARLPFPLNYQVLFFLGFLGSMMSWWNVNHIHVPDPPPQTGPQPAFRRELRGMIRFPGYLRFLVCGVRPAAGTRHDRAAVAALLGADAGRDRPAGEPGAEHRNGDDGRGFAADAACGEPCRAARPRLALARSGMRSIPC